MPSQPIRLPLRNNAGEIIAHAVVSYADRRLAKQRWYLDKGHTARSGKPYVRSTRGRLDYLHRTILGLTPDDPRKGDHINGDTLDNRRTNLRIVTPAQNAQNQGSRGGSSQHRGVTWDRARQKWLAQVFLNGKCHNLGRYDDELEAADAAARFRAERMPFSQEAA
jgi:hypothetical protein